MSVNQNIVTILSKTIRRPGRCLLPRIFTSLSAILCLALYPYAADMSDITGTRDALQCYYSGNQVRCLNIATGEDWKIFERSGNTGELWKGSINADGTKLVCEDGRRICVINLDGSNKQYVTGPRMAGGHFFRDLHGNDWVVYTGEETSDKQSGTTWKVRIDPATNSPVEETRILIVGEQYGAGLNGSGLYLGSVYRNSHLFNIETGIKSTVMFDTVSWWEPPCFYGSVNPGPQPWLMFSPDTAKNNVVIAQWQEQTNQARIIWRYEHPGGRVFAQWSVNDPGISGLVKDDSVHYVVAVTVDTSGTGHNTGSLSMAPSGLEFPDTASSILGRMWIGNLEKRAGAPLIDPPGGPVWGDSVTVTMRTITPEGVIRYTYDGTEPDAGSPVYEGAITLYVPDTEQVTLKAKTFGTSEAASPVARESYTRIVLAGPTVTSDLENGLYYEYYEGFFLFPSDIKQPWIRPRTMGRTDSFALSMRERDEEIAVRFTGYFFAEEDGKYLFFVDSDDSSELYINDSLIVASNYMHGYVSGFAGLKAGMHPLELLYHQGKGGFRLGVEYREPGQTGRSVVPSTKLFRRKSAIVITSPAEFDTVPAGSELEIAWQADVSEVESVLVQASVNFTGGWIPISPSPLAVSQTGKGSFLWTVPSALDDIVLHGARLVFRVQSVSDAGNYDVSAHSLYIKDPLSVRATGNALRRGFDLARLPDRVVVTVFDNKPHILELTQVNGKVILRKTANGAAVHTIYSSDSVAGLYLLRLLVAGQPAVTRKVIITR